MPTRMKERSMLASWAAVWLLSASLLAGLIGLQHDAAAVLTKDPAAEQTPAGPGAAPNLRIELALPTYYPEELRHPQRFFSGRSIQIVGDFPTSSTAQATLHGTATGILKTLPFERRTQGSLSFEIPEDTPTDSYEVQLVVAGESYVTYLDITGLEGELGTVAGNLGEPTLLSPAVLFEIDLNCGRNCLWEGVLTGHPTDPKHLFLAAVTSEGTRISHDGGLTWSIPDFVGVPLPQGDPDALVTPLGNLLFSHLTTISNPYYPEPNPNEFLLTAGLSQGVVTGSTFTQTVVQEPPMNLRPAIGTLVDFPKLAYDPIGGTIYVSGSMVSFEDGITGGNALFISRDGGQTFSEQHNLPLPFNEYTNFSMDTTPVGHLRATTRSSVPPWRINVLRYDAMASSSATLIPTTFHWNTVVARVSATSSKGWKLDTTAKIAIDKSPTSPHVGRMYLVWGDPHAVVSNPPGFEYSAYGVDFDIYLAYSDDDGLTWTGPIRVNDDATTADQGFPSIALDAQGRAHAAFLDKREHPTLAQYDIYYAVIKDGQVLPNIRVNGTSVPNAIGGREPGDYLKMVVAYPDKVYVFHPCEGNSSWTYAADACVTALDPRFFFPPPVLSPIGDRVTQEGVLVEWPVSASDPNGDPLTLMARQASGDPLPAGASFTDHGDGSGTFSWTPSYQQAGDYLITFTASDGELEDRETITITVTNVPLTVSSLTDAPDPFYPNAGQRSTISFTLSEPASVTLKLYNSAGSLIGTYLYNELKPQGTSTVIWDGLNRGTPYPNGTYTYKLWSTDAAGTRHQPPYPATGTITLKSLTTPGGGTPIPCTPTTTTDPDLVSAQPCASQEQ